MSVSGRGLPAAIGIVESVGAGRLARISPIATIATPGECGGKVSLFRLIKARVAADAAFATLGGTLLNPKGSMAHGGKECRDAVGTS